MGADDERLVICGGDMFKDTLHGGVSQFMKRDMAETSSDDIVMDSSLIWAIVTRRLNHCVRLNWSLMKMQTS